MATANAYALFNSDAFVIFHDVTIATSTHIQASAGLDLQDWYGSGFTFDAFGVTGGTVTGTSSSFSLYGGRLYYEVTGLNHSAVTVFNYVTANDSQGLLS